MTLQTEKAGEGQYRTGLDKLPHLPKPSRTIETSIPECRIAVWDIRRGSRTVHVITIAPCEVNYQHRILHKEGKPLVDEEGKIAVISSKNGISRKFHYNPFSEHLVGEYDRLRHHSTNGSNQNHK